jgi:hypothetical protein
MRRIAIIGACLVGACGAGAAPTPDHPVVVIGIDGLEPSVIAELLAEGRLPNFARFVGSGVVGRLASMVPTYSPVIWTTIATGQMPDAHGIDYFHDEDERPYTSNARRVPALWNIASERGLGVNCVGWWNTWPAETIRGRMLSSYAAHAQANLIWKPGVWENLEEQTWPPDLFTEIQPLMTFVGESEAVREQLFEAFPEPAVLNPTTEKSVTDLGWTYAADLSSSAVASYLFETYPADLSLVYMALPDVAGHRFWSFREPEAYTYDIDAADRAAFGDYVELAHVVADELLGRILASVPDDANVLVLSDHGMHAWSEVRDDPTSGTTGHHEDGTPGVVAAMGPNVRALGNRLADDTGGPLGSVLEIAPLVLRLLGAPVPEHWPAAKSGLVLEQVLDGEWRRANPMILTPSTDAAFRPSTPSRLPLDDVDGAFRDAFEGLGYTMGREARAASKERERAQPNEDQGR